MTSPGTSVSGADLDLHARVRQLERQVIALEAGAPAPLAPYGFSINNRPRGWLFRMQVWEDAWPEALKEQDALFCRLVDALPCDASLAAVQEDRTDKLNEGLAAALARESAVLAAWSPGVEPVHGTAERALARRVVAVDCILITEDRVCTAEDVCQAVEEGLRERDGVKGGHRLGLPGPERAWPAVCPRDVVPRCLAGICASAVGDVVLEHRRRKMHHRVARHARG